MFRRVRMIAIWKQRIGADCAHSQKPVAATPFSSPQATGD